MQASAISFFSWVLLTIPYLLHVVSLLAGLSEYFRLEEITGFNAILFICVYKAVPLVNCFIFLAAFLAHFCLRL